jgi:outer membrane protein assembly factor BamB
MVLAVGVGAPCWAEIGSKLISEQQAQQFGLTRAWTAQVELNHARNHVVRGILADDQLFVLTSAGLLQSLDAETGRTLWTVQVGNADYVSLGPTASAEYVALLNGSTLYVLDRTSGRPVLVRKIGGGPGAGPALADKYVFVPLINGRIEGYRLHDETRRPWYYQSFGQTLVTPLGTPESFVWSTSRGWLYVGDASDPNRPAVRYRLETRGPFDAPPAYLKPMLYAISAAGELYALDENTGQLEWKFVTGYPADRSPAAVGQCVYVTSQRPALYCIDAATGVPRWEAPSVAQFAAAGKTRVYGVDPFGALVAIDAATGSLAVRMMPGGPINALVNDQTDRLYLVSDGGLVQCLHEIGVTEPVRYQQAPPAAAPPDDEGPQAVPPPYQPQQPAPQVQPQQPPSPVESPFAPASPAGDENPFGEADVAGGGAQPATPTPPAATRQPATTEPPAATTQPPPAEENPFGLEGDNPFDFGE